MTRVLLVDDESLTRETLRDYLTPVPPRGWRSR